MEDYNIEDDFVTYEQALELKNMGFNYPSIRFKNNISDIYEEKSPFDWNRTEHFVSMPFFYQAFRWFRKEYNLDAEIYVKHERGNKIYTHLILSMKNGKIKPVYEGSGKFKSYEECESACLGNLIKIVKYKLYEID